jgi:hypothetical protein
MCVDDFKIDRRWDGIVQTGLILLRIMFIAYSQWITIKKSSEALMDASKEVSLEIEAEKTKYMLLSRHQNAGQNWDKK